LDDSIKSIILHGDESRIIKFCSFKCFENKNDWSKFKAKRAKKKVRKVKKQQAATNARIYKVKESPVVRLSREEIKKRKKIIKKQVTDGIAAFDKIALPLMSKAELREFAVKKKIKIPTGLSKMATASFLYKQLHPKSTKGVLKEKTAEKEMLKIENRREKKKRKSKKEVR
jgi:Cu2+-containing amine oxidase